MDVAHALAEQGAPAGTLVLADEQTAGRGRQGRRWHSPAGAGIWLGVILRPAVAAPGGVLPIRAGLALEAALRETAPGLAPRLKWPNDLLLGGAKAAGILCEARWQGDRLGWVVVGIGVNVQGPVPAEVSTLATAVSDHAPGVTRIGILRPFAQRLRALGAGRATLADEERAAYLAVLDPRGENVAGLAPDGALLVRDATGSVMRRTDAS